MKYEYVEEIRKVLVDELKDYEGEPVLLGIDESVLSQVIFNNYGDVKIFAPEVHSILKKINFSNVCFDNVYVREVDFSDYVGVKLNPQTIANQDLRYSTLSGVKIIGRFDGVDIACTNFKGSNGAVINPQTVLDKNFEGTILTDTKINGSFDGCVLNRTNFTGSECAVINPQKVANKNLSSCNFSSVTFIGPFDGCSIYNSSFEGSNGALINPQTVKDKYLVSCIFNGVEFDGPFDNCVIMHSNFTGSKYAVIDQTKLRKNNDREMSSSRLYGTNLMDAYVVDNLTDNDRLYAKIDGAHMISLKIDEEKQKEYCIRKIKESVRRK